MKKIVLLLMLLAVSMVVCFSSMANVSFYNSDSSRLSWSDHKTIAMNWNKDVYNGIMQRVELFLNGADYDSIDTNAIIVQHPEVVRQVRLEQWRRFREAGAQ